MLFWKRIYRKTAEKGLWYPVQTTVGKPVDTQELAEVLMHESTLSEADVHAVIRALPRVMAQFMADGRAVHLDGLGSFHYTIIAKGTGVETKEEVSAKQINGLRVQFIPERHKQGTEMTRALVGNVTFMEWLGKDSSPDNGNDSGGDNKPGHLE
ncbi:MAG: HU family DNA-binding protein [Prevotellaceae bacterium]|jgi:predicted histone-like DNA-binding protein|nr:HU family DNA-binding protein [Prevotellaceae bacterium]